MSDPGEIPRRNYHHFVPVLLLRHFKRVDGRVTVYDRARKWESFLQIPERVGGEKHLYSPGVELEPGGDPKDDSIERWLADEIDGPAGAPLRQLVEGAQPEDLGPDEVVALAAFIGIQDMRVPRAADLLVPAFAEAAATGIDALDQAYSSLRARGIQVTREEIRQYHAKHRERLIKEAAKPAWLRFLVERKSLAQGHVLQKRWQVIDMRMGSTFMTSDIAIAKFAGSFEFPASHEMGSYLGRDHWLMPLSPTRALALAPPLSPSFAPATAEFVRTVNRQLLLDTRRFAYSQQLINVGELLGGDA